MMTKGKAGWMRALHCETASMRAFLCMRWILFLSHAFLLWWSCNIDLFCMCISCFSNAFSRGFSTGDARCIQACMVGSCVRDVLINVEWWGRVKLVGCVLCIANQLPCKLSPAYAASSSYRMHLYFRDFAVWSAFVFAHLRFRVHLRVYPILAMHGASGHVMCFICMVAQMYACNEITFLTSLQILFGSFLQFVLLNELQMLRALCCGSCLRCCGCCCSCGCCCCCCSCCWCCCGWSSRCSGSSHKKLFHQVASCWFVLCRHGLSWNGWFQWAFLF